MRKLKTQDCHGYVLVWLPEHPHSGEAGYVYEHTLIAEAALGKLLPDKACVHHVNLDESDNGRGNLVLCQDHAYHKLLHMRQRALDACGNANWRKCPYCFSYDDPTNMIVHDRGRQSPAYCHHECRKASHRRARAA